MTQGSCIDSGSLIDWPARSLSACVHLQLSAQANEPAVGNLSFRRLTGGPTHWWQLHHHPSQAQRQYHPKHSLPQPPSANPTSSASDIAILWGNQELPKHPGPSTSITSITMADAALKPEKDFSKEADKQIPEAEKLAKVCISCSPSQSPLSNQY